MTAIIYIILKRKKIFFLIFGIFFIICFSLTIITTNLKKRIVELTQEISLLKGEK